MTIAATSTPIRFRGHIPEIDGLRAIAVLLVFFHHFWPPRLKWWPIAPLSRMGWIGVDMFFVLSGFLIGGILLDAKDSARYYRDFYIRRTLRIFPLYYCTMAAIVAFLLLYRHGALYSQVLSNWGSPAWFFAYLGNVRTTMVGKWPGFEALVPLWSLQIEEQFYLLFPFVVKHCNTTVLSRLLMVVVVASPWLRLGLYWLIPGNPFIQYSLLPSRWDGLALGALIALRFRTGPWDLNPRLVTGAMISLLAALSGVLWWGGYNWSRPLIRTVGYSSSAMAFAAVLLWALVYRSKGPTAFLRMPPFQYVGKVSYGMYLLQEPAHTASAGVAKMLGWQLSASVPTFLFRFITTLTLSTASWQLLEKPCLKLKDRFAPQTAKRH